MVGPWLEDCNMNVEAKPIMGVDGGEKPWRSYRVLYLERLSTTMKSCVVGARTAAMKISLFASVRIVAAFT
jgi:hypothetical protein